MNFSSQE